jgi:tetratricopeptide (TPR) repeat protein
MLDEKGDAKLNPYEHLLRQLLVKDVAGLESTGLGSKSSEVKNLSLQATENGTQEKPVDQASSSCLNIDRVPVTQIFHPDTIISYDQSAKLSGNNADSISSNPALPYTSSNQNGENVIFSPGVRFEPNYYDAWLGFGHFLASLGQDNEAISYFEQAIRSQPNDYKAWMALGQSFAKLDRFEDAIIYFQKAIKLSPDNYKTWIQLGKSFAKLNNIDEAINAFYKTIDIVRSFDAGNLDQIASEENIFRYADGIVSIVDCGIAISYFLDSWSFSIDIKNLSCNLKINAHGSTKTGLLDQS